MPKIQPQKLKTLKVLKNRSDFLTIAKSGKKWVAQSLILQAMPNDLDEIRVGYTVSKKTDSSAVKRNRIKRRLRNVAKDVLPLEAAHSHDFVIIGRPGAALRPYESLQQDLRWCLGKLNLGRHKSD